MAKAAVLLSLFALVSLCYGRNLLSNTLGSHMVLQRGPQQARVWGWTQSPNVAVVVQLNDVPFRTSSGADSKWSVSFPPQQAGGPHKISVQAATGESVTIEDVFFGDVFVCSGQSNMQMTVTSTFNASQEIARANDYPFIRLFTVGQGTVSDQPLEELATISQSWAVASSRTVGAGAWSYFSSLCWFFGRDIADRYKIPIGLVSTNWGGTYVQAWSSSDALAKCPTQTLPAIVDNTQEERQANPNQPSVLWNAMVVPFLPMRVRGGIWYQGESNVGNAKYYGCAFTEMIRDWRAKWGLTDAQFPFFFIQLAAYTQGGPYGTRVAELRFSQTKALSLPFVGMATGVDLGDLTSPDGNIHPRDKQGLGYRSYLLAQTYVYGESNVINSGPVATNFSVLAPGPNAVVRVSFGPQDVGDREPVFHPTLCPASLLGTNECGWFDITTSGGVFNATATLGNNNGGFYVDLRANVGGSTVTGARYGYADWPVCTLYNKAGLPAPPFIFPPPF